MPYTTVAEVRALDGLADVSVYPDATLQAGIDYATSLIDSYCGTSFEPKTFSVTLDGNNRPSIFTGVLFIRSLTSVTIDGVTQTIGDLVTTPWGELRHKNGYFAYQWWGQNIVVAGTAGVTTTPDEEIKTAARAIARQYALDLHSRIPSRALSVTNELGQFEVRAQAGGPGRPTSMPDVNRILNAPNHKHKAGMGAVFG